MVSAVATFVVNLLAAAGDVNFRWYATWNVFEVAFGVDFLAATTRAVTAILSLSVVLFVRRVRRSVLGSWIR